jgi:hypothetical protein
LESQKVLKAPWGRAERRLEGVLQLVRVNKKHFEESYWHEE